MSAARARERPRGERQLLGKQPALFATATPELFEAETVLGTPAKGPWSHLTVTLPRVLLFTGAGVKTSSQVAAERLEDHRTLVR